MTLIDMRVAPDCRNAKSALTGLAPGVCIHGITDGSWSLSDAMREMCRLAGFSDVVISTWTAASADLRSAQKMLRSTAIRSLRLIVDRSFISRQPKYCAAARSYFGDDAIRVWSNHAKFCIVVGDAMRILYLTSANLNRNVRMESFSAICSDELVAEYSRMVDELYSIQRPGEGFSDSKAGRRDTAKITKGRGETTSDISHDQIKIEVWDDFVELKS